MFYCSICGIDLLRAGSVYSHRCRESKIAQAEAEYAGEEAAVEGGPRCFRCGSYDDCDCGLPADHTAGR